MKFNKSVIALGLGLALSASAFAGTNQGSGQVHFKGEIIEAPCSITPDTVDQTVDMGKIATSALANGGRSDSFPFQIDLKNCSTTALSDSTVTVTFEGPRDGLDNAALGIEGQAKNAAIYLTNGGGKTIDLGQPSDAIQITDGSNTLNFSSYLKGYTETMATPGEFTATTNFVLTYQ